MNRAPAPIGTPAELLKTSALWDPTWFPTVIAPFQTGGVVNKLFFWVHLLVWILTIGLSGTSNGGAWFLQRFDPACDSLDETCFSVPFSTLSGIIGWVSAASLVFSVVMIIMAASVWDINQTRREVEYLMILLFFQFTSLVGSFWIFVKASNSLTSVAFYLSLAGVVVHIYSSCLFFSCMAAMRVVSVARVTLPMFATAVSILVAVATQLNEMSLGDAWDTGLPVPFSYGQKFVGFLVPCSQLTGILSMVVLRRVSSDEDSLSDLQNWPFVRTTILFSFFFSAVASVYVFSFLRQDTDPISAMFGLAGVLLSCFSVLSVFAPNAKGEYGERQYDFIQQ